MALLFDPIAKRIILDSGNVNASLIYSAWVNWISINDNIKYLPAFRAVGGDDLGDGLLIPPYYFLTNGWLIRPMETSHSLVLTGNLFVDGGGEVITPTLGTFTVLAKLVVPVQAQGFSTSGGSSLSANQIATAVWNTPISEISDKSKIGGYITKTLLSIPKFLGLK